MTSKNQLIHPPTPLGTFKVEHGVKPIFHRQKLEPTRGVARELSEVGLVHARRKLGAVRALGAVADHPPLVVSDEGAELAVGLEKFL